MFGSQTSPLDVQMLSLRDVFRRFWPYTKPVRPWLWLSLVFVGLMPALSAAGVWLFKVLVDEVIVPRRMDRFPMLACAFLGLTVVSAGASMIDRSLSTWIAETFLLDLRVRLFDHVLGL